MSEKRIYRQGDVLLIEASLPDGKAREMARDDNGRLVLAQGEVTGHHHVIAEPAARLYQFDDGTRYLWLDAPENLRHEEHLPVALPAKVFKVVIQREYVPGPIPHQYPEVAD